MQISDYIGSASVLVPPLFLFLSLTTEGLRAEKHDLITSQYQAGGYSCLMSIKDKTEGLI